MPVVLQSRRIIIGLICIAVAVYAATIVLIVLAALTSQMRGSIFAIVVLAALSAILTVKLVKEIRRPHGPLVISPEGITLSDGETIPAGGIDSCHIHYRVFSVRDTRYGDGDKGFARIVVLLKDGKKRIIDLGAFRFDPEKEAETFHQRVNAVEGLPHFEEPVIERLS